MLSVDTVLAHAALRRPADDDVVALGEGGHPGTDLDDLAGALVAEHRGYGDRDGAVHRRQVGVTDAGRPDADLHLAGADRGGRDVVTDVETFVADLVQHCCFHASTSFSASARFGQESTALRALPRRSSAGYSSCTSRLSSSSTSKTSGRIPAQTALASHSSWSTTIFIRPTAAVEPVPTMPFKAGADVF